LISGGRLDELLFIALTELLNSFIPEVQLRVETPKKVEIVERGLDFFDKNFNIIEA
jgi:hypothetical protein